MQSLCTNYWKQYTNCGFFFRLLSRFFFRFLLFILSLFLIRLERMNQVNKIDLYKDMQRIRSIFAELNLNCKKNTQIYLCKSNTVYEREQKTQSGAEDGDRRKRGRLNLFKRPRTARGTSSCNRSKKTSSFQQNNFLPL